MRFIGFRESGFAEVGFGFPWCSAINIQRAYEAKTIKTATMPTKVVVL